MTSVQRATPITERAEMAEHAEGWATFILANILWAILSIPVVTIPVATSGLVAFMSAKMRGEQPDLFRVYFDAARTLWLKATVIALLDVLCGALIIANTLILTSMNVSADPIAFLSRSVTAFAAIAVLLINLYAWHLLVLLENMNVWQIIAASARLAFTHPLWSFGVLIAAMIPVGVSLLLPQGIFVIATASIAAWIVCKGTWIVIRRYLAPVST